MFTGLIEEIGHIEKFTKNNHTSKLTIRCSDILNDIRIGDSIAVNGICLTVTHFDRLSFVVDVMNETWLRTSLASLQRGSPVNLERALSFNGRIGGHLVSGHIDGTGMITNIQKDQNAVWYSIKTTPDILSFIIEKGSIAIDGTSLTVAKRSAYDFSVSVIPHTLQKTILKDKHVKSIVNLENDMIGKYVSHFLQSHKNSSLESLLQNDF